MKRGKQEKVTLSPYNFRVLDGFMKVHRDTKSKSSAINEIFGYGVKNMNKSQIEQYLKAADEQK